MVLQSSAFASSQFEKISQENWVTLLDAMVALANKKGLDPAVLVNWKETRDETVVDMDEDELDFSDFAELE
jgi:hypothetical protein